ncbi:hypothetical protein HU200_028683 [Digitaria exilis]|uniref:DUF1618 domain-containing protein n=1 Tax=Digitaria exilis TaxID=1010633 RepID=A0A835ESQ9_9POAL|nr:hypothetical protein HU200_028683 [Digitaria exilis]
MFASDCVLLRADAFRDRKYSCDTTLASAVTSRHLPIEVSLRCPECPLLPVVLFVRIPGVHLTDDPPRIVRAVEDLILIRVPIPTPEAPRFPPVPSDDYFIYRIGLDEGTSSLRLLPHATTFFNDDDVGLLRRDEEHYTVAALLIGSKYGVYDLHRFDSETDRWALDEVPLVEPQVSFPYKSDIPMNSRRVLYHLTTTVIPIGGGGGTMGWVDLWHGVLLCDVLSSEPKLRGVPLPLPLEHLSLNHGLGVELGCPKSLRGIGFIDNPGTDEECCDDEWEMHDWTLTTWSNKKMTTSWEDWHMDGQVKASDTTISDELNSKMLKSGLLSTESGRAFQNLLVSIPALGIDDGVVYLQARVRFWDSKVFVLALDTRVNKLLGVVEFGTERSPRTGIVYVPSSIGKYIYPDYRMVVPEGTFQLINSFLNIYIENPFYSQV